MPLNFSTIVTAASKMVNQIIWKGEKSAFSMYTRDLLALGVALALTLIGVVVIVALAREQTPIELLRQLISAVLKILTGQPN
jgi:hypothetical protein